MVSSGWLKNFICIRWPSKILTRFVAGTWSMELLVDPKRCRLLQGIIHHCLSPRVAFDPIPAANDLQP